MKKKLMLVLMLTVLSAVLFAGGGAQGTAAQTSQVKRDNLNFGLIGEPKTMDPSQVSDLVSFGLFFQIYDFLVRQEADDSITPGLAERWELSNGGKEVTYYLRRGVRFHDGTEMKAADVAFSFNRAIASSYTVGATACMDRMEIIDDYTVKLFLKFPYGPLDYCISSAQMGIISKAAFERDPAAFARNPVGTGPYKFVDWRPGNEINLTRFDGYWKGPAPIKDVKYRVILDGATAVMALQNGEVDIVDTPPPTDRTTLRQDPRITYYETEIAAWVFLAFNCEPGRLFSDVRLRKAFAMAVDKEDLIIGAREGLGTAIETPWANSVNLWNPNFKNVQFDPAGAQALLAQAGYPNGLEVTMKTTDSATYYKPTEVIQGQLEKIGVKVNIERMERTAYFESVQTHRDYDVCVLATTTSVPDPDTIYSTFHSSGLATGRAYYNVNDPELDRLLDAGRYETDQAKRQVIYDQISEIFKNQVYSFSLYTYFTPVAANKDLKGVTINSKNRLYCYDYSW